MRVLLLHTCVNQTKKCVYLILAVILCISCADKCRVVYAEDSVQHSAREQDVTLSRAILVGNGFQQVVVAFASSVNETQGWIAVNNTIELLSHASERLYVATRKRVYFEDIHILIPNSWSKPPPHLQHLSEEMATFEHFNSADFQISEGPARVPYTKNLLLAPDACGQPQGNIEIPLKFVLQYGQQDALNKLVDARRIVQQWAKHRWGVFEEYVDEDALRDEVLRNSEQRILEPIINFIAFDEHFPNICIWPRNVDLMHQLMRAGQFKNVLTNVTCDPSDDTHCLFHFNPRNGAQLKSQLHASVMSMPTLPNADEFCNCTMHGSSCTNPSLPSGENWPLGETPHNKHCQYESTWNVMTTRSTLQDLYLDRSPPREGVTSTPKFHIVRQPNQPRVVLLLDTSHSKGDKMFSLMQASVGRFVRFLAEDEWAMALVTFDETAHVNVPLVNVSTHRHLFINEIRSLKSQGKACISFGIKEALEVLSVDKGHQKGGHIILISDGLESCGIPASELLDDVRSSGATLSVVSLLYPTEVLSSLASVTPGGRFYIVPPGDRYTLSALDQALFDATNSIGSSSLSYKMKILSEEIPLGWSQFGGTFPVDESAASDLMILFSYSPPISIKDMRITNPRGTVFNFTSDKFVADFRRSHVHFRFPKAEIGVWEYKVTLKEGALPALLPSTLEVTARTLALPLQLKAHIISDYNSYEKSTRFVAVIAELTQGWKPVRGACVTATVYNPNGTSMELKLLDNAVPYAPHRLSTSDGIYKEILQSHDDPGWYLVTITASSISNSTKILQAPWPHAEKDIRSFQRVVVAGTFSEPIQTISLGNDTSSPPCPIKDLTNVSPVFNYGVITLVWTAPGSHWNKGTAMLYEFRYSTSEQQLLANFESATRLTDSNIQQGSLKPKPAGTHESISFLLPDGKYFIAGRALDGAGRKGRVITAVFVRPLSKCLDTKDYEHREFYEHPKNCTLFLHCEHAGFEPQVKFCPASLYFNAKTNQCDYQNNVQCRANRLQTKKLFGLQGSQELEYCSNFRVRKMG